MSTGPTFKTVVYVGSSSVDVYTANKEGWKKFAAEFTLDSTPTNDLVALTQGSNVLVLVSDVFAGHLQVVFPNKKDQLTDEHLGQVLRKDYDIDLEAYEFASQKFPVTRDRVQVSVSGLERGKYQEALDWVRQLLPKKIWVMPFGWFMSPLKSVEPVLLAVVRNSQEVLVSHHYLGVDDAREIALADLVEYCQARKEERKETHLLYLQSTSPQFTAVEKELSDSVAVHPLLPEFSSDVLEDVIAAVMQKGNEALAQQLHFEEEAPTVEDLSVLPVDTVEIEPELKAEAKAKGKKSKDEAKNTDDSSKIEESALSAADLPRPTPPVAIAVLDTEAVTAEFTPDEESAVEEVEEGVDVQTEGGQDGGVVEEVESSEFFESPVESEEDREEMGELEIESNEPEITIQDTEGEGEEVSAELETSSGTEFLSTLTADKVKKTSNDARYREMPNKRQSWAPVVLVFLLVAIITSVVGGAVFWSQQMPGSSLSMLPEESPSPTPAATPVATPTPQPSVLSEDEKGDLTVAVFNATSKAGLAGRYASALEGVGWTDTSSGNATGEYESGVFIYTTNDTAFDTLSKELTGVTITRLTANEEKSAASADVVIVINNSAEPKVVMASVSPSPTASPSSL